MNSGLFASVSVCLRGEIVIKFSSRRKFSCYKHNQGFKALSAISFLFTFSGRRGPVKPFSPCKIFAVDIMVIIIDGNSEHVAIALRKIGLYGGEKMICDCSRSNEITKIATYVRTYF